MMATLYVEHKGVKLLVCSRLACTRILVKDILDILGALRS